jgi:hypothetical protein
MYDTNAQIITGTVHPAEAVLSQLTIGDYRVIHDFGSKIISKQIKCMHI